MNQITRPRMVLLPPMHPLTAISARLEDLPPPLCAWASLTLRTATSADALLLVADGADEAAREAGAEAEGMDTTSNDHTEIGPKPGASESRTGVLTCVRFRMYCSSVLRAGERNNNTQKHNTCSNCIKYPEIFINNIRCSSLPFKTHD